MTFLSWVAAAVLVLATTLCSVFADPYIYYPLSPNALYQNYMRVSLASGQFKFFNDLPGIGSYGSYNGAFGITFDNTATVAFVTAVESKRLRKLNLASEYVGADITRKKPMLIAESVNIYLYIYAYIYR